MSEEKKIGNINILNIVDNNNGTSTLTYEVPHNIKEYFKNHFGWKRWSSRKFNEFFLRTLQEQARKEEEKLHNDQRNIDIFDSNIKQGGG